ncbi:hypothetical protein [Uliginosibacterium gangwonense]|uniref:hypothetical protein n=1 Tax=Uliginosibacterium gangwonense TaxID=392736 RepID=UPI00035F953E|nr:hypothetical protein [Uliginosibacterium gangwonense]
MPTPKTPRHSTTLEIDQVPYKIFMLIGGFVETDLPVVIAMCHDPKNNRANLRFDVDPARAEEQLGDLSAEEIFERCLTQMHTRRLVPHAYTLANKSYVGMFE